MENVRVMDDAEIKTKGMEALYESLGVAGALKFMSLLHREPTNYVDVSKLHSGEMLTVTIKN